MRSFALLVVAVALALSFAPRATAQAPMPELRIAGITQSQLQALQTEVRRAAAARGVSERALAAVAERLGASFNVNGHVDVDQILAAIDERAQQVVNLQQQIAELQRGGGDGPVAALLREADAAIESGDLNHADQLLAQAADLDQARAAQTTGQRARLAEISGRHMDAGGLYARAAELAPESDAHARWIYRMHEAECYYARGFPFGHFMAFDADSAVAVRQRAPVDWAARRLQVLPMLGHGDTLLRDAMAVQRVALQHSEQALRQALDLAPRGGDPRAWAIAQYNLALVLMSSSSTREPARAAALAAQEAFTSVGDSADAEQARGLAAQLEPMPAH